MHARRSIAAPRSKARSASPIAAFRNATASSALRRSTAKGVDFVVRLRWNTCKLHRSPRRRLRPDRPFAKAPARPPDRRRSRSHRRRRQAAARHVSSSAARPLNMSKPSSSGCSRTAAKNEESSIRAVALAPSSSSRPPRSTRFTPLTKSSPSIADRAASSSNACPARWAFFLTPFGPRRTRSSIASTNAS